MYEFLFTINIKARVGRARRLLFTIETIDRILPQVSILFEFQ